MKQRRPKGEVTITLLILIMMLIIITTSAVAVAVSSMQDNTSLTLGEETRTLSESAAENAILRLLRDPSYTGELNLPIGDGNATIAVVGTTTKTITSTATLGRYRRSTQVVVEIVAGQLNILSWQEI